MVAVFYVCAVLLGMACSEPLFLSDPPPEPTPPKPSLSEAPMVKIESPLRKRLESVPFEDKKLLEPEDSVTESDTSGTVTLVMESIAIKVSPVDTKTAFVLQSPAAGKMEIPPVFVTAPVKEEGGGVSLTARNGFHNRFIGNGEFQKGTEGWFFLPRRREKISGLKGLRI